MPSDDSRYDQVTVYVDRVLRTTDKAALCLVNNDTEVWLPWSQIDEGSEVQQKGDEGEVYIPRWLAEKNELPYSE